jgi:hypothetical protein
LVSGSGSVTAEMQIEKVGRLLGRIGYHAADNERNAFGENGEVEVRMKRDRLACIALLADDGYWLNVDPRYDGVRSGQRFSKAEAERTADILEDFDRAVARPFMGETAEEKEQRSIFMRTGCRVSFRFTLKRCSCIFLGNTADQTTASKGEFPLGSETDRGDRRSG